MEQVTLGVKLNETEAAVFQRWCERQGMSPSQTLGYVIECIIKMQSVEAINNEKLQEAMHVWDDFKDFDKVKAVLLPGGDAEVVQAVYFINQKGIPPKYGWRPYQYKLADGTEVKKKKWMCIDPGTPGGHSSMAVLVEPSMGNEPIYSTDSNEIVDEVLARVAKALNRHLRNIAKRTDTTAPIETMNFLCDYYERNEDEDSQFIQDMFSDNGRHEYGRDIDTDIQYKRHNKRSIKEPTQLTLFSDLFEHEQKDINEAENNEQGCEVQEGDSNPEMEGTDAEDED